MNLRHKTLVMAARYAPRLLSLERLGKVHGTDKVDLHHTHNGRTLCSIYDTYLHGWRRDHFDMVEIGVLRGASLRMWRSYFPRATVRGLDVDPEAAERAADFEVIVGSQGDPTVLERAATPYLRLVVDDGSHVNELTIASFRHLFPRLARGGVYIIEDLSPGSYEPAWESWSGMALNDGISLDNRREDVDELVVELMHNCDNPHGKVSAYPNERIVAFVHAWPAALVVGRA